MDQLRVFFDFTCPYCYLAWGYFKKVKESVKLNDDWVGWEIHPEVPKEGRPIQELLQGVDLAERRRKLNSLGKPVGLIPGERTDTPNTRLALCAAEFAREAGKLHEWIDVVYQASFMGKKNISDIGVLLDLARQIGMDSGVLRQTLESEKYVSVLLAHETECIAKKVEWVPTVYMGERKIIEGAFTFAEFEQVIHKQFPEG